MVNVSVHTTPRDVTVSSVWISITTCPGDRPEGTFPMLVKVCVNKCTYDNEMYMIIHSMKSFTIFTC
jgi:hypothetical protein